MIKSEINIFKLAALIKQSKAILILAGAGMSVDSGISQFRGNNGYWTKYLSFNNEEINYQDLMTHQSFIDNYEKSWRLINQLKKDFNNATPHNGYKQLLEMIEAKEYFVITSNCDEQFQKGGFNELGILEIHGSIYNIQCIDNCDNEIWMNQKNSFSTIPKCLKCGKNSRPNILLFGDYYWNSSIANDQQQRYINWKRINENNNLLVIEIGAGTTINSIRKIGDSYSLKGHSFVRINPNDSEVKNKNAISIPFGAEEVINKVYKNFAKRK